MYVLLHPAVISLLWSSTHIQKFNVVTKHESHSQKPAININLYIDICCRSFSCVCSVRHMVVLQINIVCFFQFILQVKKGAPFQFKWIQKVVAALHFKTILLVQAPSCQFGKHFLHLLADVFHFVLPWVFVLIPERKKIIYCM